MQNRDFYMLRKNFALITERKNEPFITIIRCYLNDCKRL